MPRYCRYAPLPKRGIALILSLIFLLIFSTLAISFVSFATTNAQLAINQHSINAALATAQSGQEILRYALSQVSLAGTTPPSERFDRIISSLRDILIENDMTGINLQCDGTVVTIAPVILNSLPRQTFAAQITQIDTETLAMEVVGTHGDITRTVLVHYQLGTRSRSVFDFGVATRGPLSLTGNILLDGANLSVESDVYIESSTSDLALSITGNSQIAGDVKIVNPQASVTLQGKKAGIGGQTGQEAIDNHVAIPAPQTEFPFPDTAQFAELATNVIDSDTDTSSPGTFENVRILPNTNPTFSGNVTFRGIIFIETPNVVTFSGTANITGIVVGNGDCYDDSGANRILFQGNVVSRSVTELPNEPQFEDIRNKTGTFVIAPGFEVSFGGNFDALVGAIAANGVKFFGNAGGIVNGSIVNYAQTAMTLTGNNDLLFNRSGIDHIPAGFVPEIVLHYSPTSYSEINSCPQFARQ